MTRAVVGLATLRHNQYDFTLTGNPLSCDVALRSRRFATQSPGLVMVLFGHSA